MGSLLFIALLPVVLIVLFIYKKDRIKEPPKLLWKLFFAGFGSAVLVWLVSQFLTPIFPILSDQEVELGLFELFINVMIGVALVEEVCKWFMVYTISFNHESFDELYDMILYSVLVSLGFATIENILYIYSLGFETGVYRAIFAVPGHACDGVFMGYYLGLAKICSINGLDSEKKKNIFLSILVPTLLHGIYDFCIFSKLDILILVFFIFVLILYIKSIKKINKVSKLNSKFKNKTFCANCGAEVNTNYCTNCGTKNERL